MPLKVRSSRKAGLNGALTLGTLDGANVEIRDEVGPENIFIFGHTAPEIEALRASGYDPRTWVEKNAELRRAVDAIARGPLEKAHPGLFRPVVEELLGPDRYFLCADFDAYVECQRRAAETYQRPQDWARMSVLNVAGMDRFSSDRTAREYASDIWSAAPVRVRLEGASSARGTRGKPRAR